MSKIAPVYGLKVVESEFDHWKDVGCPEVSPSCLACPLPKCKHDDPFAHRSRGVRMKWQGWINTMETEKLTVDQIAKKVRVTPRTIFRAISTIKRERLQNA